MTYEEIAKSLESRLTPEQKSGLYGYGYDTGIAGTTTTNGITTNVAYDPKNSLLNQFGGDIIQAAKFMGYIPQDIFEQLDAIGKNPTVLGNGIEAGAATAATVPASQKAFEEEQARIRAQMAAQGDPYSPSPGSKSVSGQNGYNNNTENPSGANIGNNVRNTSGPNGQLYDNNGNLIPPTQAPAPQSQAAPYGNGSSQPSGQGQSGNQAVPISTPFQFSGMNLSLGSKGNSVSQLQQALGITADGIFGPKTQAAVKQYQMSKGLTPDGIVGPKTMAALNQGNTSPTSGVEAGIKSGSTSNADGLTDVFKNLGIDVAGILNNPLSSPQNNVVDTYTQIYEKLGLADIKSQYAKFTKEYEDLQNKKNDETQTINNDPWLTEGVRVQRLRQLDSKYEGKEEVLKGKLDLTEKMYESGRDDAQYLLGQAMTQTKNVEDFNQDLILKAIDIAENAVKARNAIALKQTVPGKNTSKVGGSGTTNGSVKFTPTEQKNYEAYASEISSYNSQSSALNDLAVNKAAIIKSIGQKGYNKLESDIKSFFSSRQNQSQFANTPVSLNQGNVASGGLTIDYLSNFLFK